MTQLKRSAGPLIDIAYWEIKDALITCRILPGQELFESQFAEPLGMSKTPVREALQRLVQEGFVALSSRRSYRAAPITLADVQEVFELRALLEPVSAAHVAQRASSETLEALRKLASATENSEARAHGRRPRVDFHVALARACGNRRLARAQELLLEETSRIFHLLDLTLRAELPSHAHKDLADALVRRDHAEARSLRTRDIELSRSAVTDALSGRASDSPSVELSPAANPLLVPSV